MGRLLCEHLHPELLKKQADKTVLMKGWVHKVRRANKSLQFVELRDHTGVIQVVLYGAPTLLRESVIEVEGTLQNVKNAPQRTYRMITNMELLVTKPIIVHSVCDPEINERINSDSSTHQLFQQRHLAMRTDSMIKLMHWRNLLSMNIRLKMVEDGIFEVTPPTIVNGTCEDGGSLFTFDFYGEKAALTQSSQMYLESLLPSFGPVFCFMSSFRAEQSQTRRHLAEFTHLEVELPFIKFEELLQYIEDFVYYLVYQNKEMGKPPHFEKPFVRMTYHQAIDYCREHGILNEKTQQDFEYGEDITEAPERALVDRVGKPVFITHFPFSMKAFYMKRDPSNPELTESADLLMPGVGEIIGSSMRASTTEELMGNYKEKHMDAEKFEWYNDLRRFGTVEHGGFGMGFERLLMYIQNTHSVKDCCFYPRYMGHCQP